jgi:hypothetical protein
VDAGPRALGPAHAQGHGGKTGILMGRDAVRRQQPPPLSAPRAPQLRLGFRSRERLELGNADVAVRKHGADFELPAHGLDDMPQGTHVRVWPAFQEAQPAGAGCRTR